MQKMILFLTLFSSALFANEKLALEQFENILNGKDFVVFKQKYFFQKISENSPKTKKESLKKKWEVYVAKDEVSCEHIESGRKFIRYLIQPNNKYGMRYLKKRWNFTINSFETLGRAGSYPVSYGFHLRGYFSEGSFAYDVKNNEFIILSSNVSSFEQHKTYLCDFLMKEKIFDVQVVDKNNVPEVHMKLVAQGPPVQYTFSFNPKTKTLNYDQALPYLTENGWNFAYETSTWVLK